MRQLQTVDAGYAGEAGGFAPPQSTGGSPLGTTWPDGTLISCGTGTGAQIGTGPTQKLAFFGAAPVARPAALAAPSGTSLGTAGSTYTTTERDLINALVAVVTNQRTRLNDLETKLQALGLLA